MIFEVTVTGLNNKALFASVINWLNDDKYCSSLSRILILLFANRLKSIFTRSVSEIFSCENNSMWPRINGQINTDTFFNFFGFAINQNKTNFQESVKSNGKILKTDHSN